ncbi:TlpA family protein disulfide reductase [Lutibacter sp.]
MKKIVWIFAVILVVSCNTEVKEHVKIRGKLKTPGVEKIAIQGRGFSKDIKVNSDGTFSDTLTVKTGIHAIVNGNDRITLFLRNGYDLTLDFKGERFSDGIHFSGIGAETNNFMDSKRSFYMSEYANPKTYFKLDKEAYEAKLAEAKEMVQGYIDKAKNIDSLVSDMDKRNNEMFFKYIESNYEKAHNDLLRLAKGNKSPVFVGYENIDGNKTSLEDLKGKYVYIDVWATWCAPCKAEIPYLKEMEKQFHGKNIEFVSISVDKKDDYEVWKKMVAEKELSGIQLFADNSWESDFIKDYGINAIPRFILIDPKGNIVDSDALRPSNPELKKMLEELGI